MVDSSVLQIIGQLKNEIQKPLQIRPLISVEMKILPSEIIKKIEQQLKDSVRTFQASRDRIIELGHIYRDRIKYESTNMRPDKDLSILLEEFAESIEKTVEESAVKRSKLKKISMQRFKHIASIDPLYASVYLNFHNSLLQLDDDIVEELLDIASFSRARAAENDPESRGDPVIDNPKDLENSVQNVVST